MDLETLARRVAVDGPFAQEENERIFKKWFVRGPRRRTTAMLKRYGLDKKTVLDVGAGYGNNLIYFGSGSYGVEIDARCVQFATAIGLEVYQCDVAASSVPVPRLAEVAIAWAVMEHVESPHRFLRNISTALQSEGLLILYVPTVPIFAPSWLPRVVRKHLSGHRHGDHINAFSCRTLRFICERAGFKTISCSPGFYGFWKWLNFVPGLASFVDGAVYVGEKIPNWNYPEGSTRSV